MQKRAVRRKEKALPACLPACMALSFGARLMLWVCHVLQSSHWMHRRNLALQGSATKSQPDGSVETAANREGALGGALSRGRGGVIVTDTSSLSSSSSFDPSLPLLLLPDCVIPGMLLTWIQGRYWHDKPRGQRGNARPCTQT